MSNPVTRWQIISATPGVHSDFYRKLFGWNMTRNNLLSYETVDTGSARGAHGGIWPAPPDVTSFVQLYVEVDDCEAYVRSASELGATVIMPPQVLPDGDTMAVLRDPGGVSFGIVQMRGMVDPMR